MSRRWSLDRWRNAARLRVGVHLSPGGVAMVKLPAKSETPASAAEYVALSAERGLDAVLADLVGRHGLQRADCVLTLAPSDYALFQVEKPNVPAEELLAAARWRIREMLSYPVDEAVVDAFEVPGMESRGRPPSLMVAAARRSELKARVDQLKHAGLRPVAIGIAEIALRKLATRALGSDESLAVLMLGRTPGCLAVVQGDTLYVSRKLELDGNDLRVLASPGDDAAPLERSMDRLALELQRTGDYYDSTYQRAPLRKVLLLVDDPRLQSLAPTLRNALGLQALDLDLAALLGAGGEIALAQQAPLLLAAAGAWREAA